MNILFICSSNPELCNTGSQQRTHFIYEALRKLGDVYVMAFGLGPTEETRYIKSASLKPKSLIARGINFLKWRLMYSIAPESPILRPFPWRLDIEGEFPNISFDAVVVRYLCNVVMTAPWGIAPLYVDIDDHPLQLYATKVGVNRVKWLNKIANLYIRKMVDDIVRRCEGCWIANSEQEKWFKEKDKIFPLKNIPIFPNSLYDRYAKRSRFLLTVGHMAYEPNYLGIDSFLKNVWPKVRVSFGDLTYKIAGGELPSAYVRKWSKIEGVEYLGFVDSLADLYAKAIATIVPVDSGGGTCIKTLESLAYCRVCFATPFGARGIPDSDLIDGEKGIVVYRDGDEFIRSLKLIMNESTRKRMEDAAVEYCKSFCSVDTFASEVAAAFN